MNFTHPQLKILAFSAAVARLNQPVLFSVLRLILRNRSWQQEMKHEEEIRARSVGNRGLGRDPGWDKRPSTAPMIRLLLESLPESVRLVLWHSLRERYTVQETPPDVHVKPKANQADDDDVVVAPI